MAAYLEASHKEGGPAPVAAALGGIARAKGMTQLARDTGLGRERLCRYKALSPTGNPEFATSMTEHFDLHGGRLAREHAELQQCIQVRFAEPDLHAHLLSWSVMGQTVVDHEHLTRNFLDGRGHVEMICTYDVAAEVVIKATFALGNPTSTVHGRKHADSPNQISHLAAKAR